MAAATTQARAELDPPVKPSVTGKFIGNGKNAELKFVIVQGTEPFNDKEAIRIIFTEKDPATSKKPDFDAAFGKLGSSLVLSVHHDGGIFGCQVAHSAHEKQGFSSVGAIKMEGFKIAGGNVSGRVITGKELDFFGEKWEVDLTFAAPLPENLRNTPVVSPKPEATESVKPAMKETTPPVGPVLYARKLPLPKDAADVDFKQLVNQIHCTSARPVAEVTKEIVAALKQQGWKDGVGNIMGNNNAILKREQGAAKLTVIIQPTAQGCGVKYFPEGLDWSETDDAATPAPKAQPKVPSVDDIDATVNKALQDALKQLPK